MWNTCEKTCILAMYHAVADTCTGSKCQTVEEVSKMTNVWPYVFNTCIRHMSNFLIMHHVLLKNTTSLT